MCNLLTYVHIINNIFEEKFEVGSHFRTFKIIRHQCFNISLNFFLYTSGDSSDCNKVCSIHNTRFFSGKQLWWTLYPYGILQFLTTYWSCRWKLCDFFLSFPWDLTWLQMMHSFPFGSGDLIILDFLGQLSGLDRDKRFVVSEFHICAWNYLCIKPSCAWHGMS